MGGNVLFFILLIDKQSRYTHLSYLCQKSTAEKTKLAQEKQAYTNQLYALNDTAFVKKSALETLHMQPLSLRRIKKVVLS